MVVLLVPQHEKGRDAGKERRKAGVWSVCVCVCVCDGHIAPKLSGYDLCWLIRGETCVRRARKGEGLVLFSVYMTRVPTTTYHFLYDARHSRHG